GRRMILAAADVDPASPWPHVFRGVVGLEGGGWDEVVTGFSGAARVDPDTTYYLLHNFVLPMARFAHRPDGSRDDEQVLMTRLVEAAAAQHPDHPGAHDLRAALSLMKGDYRKELEDLRKALERSDDDYPRRDEVRTELRALEAAARWEGKADAVKEPPPDAADAIDLAGYRAMFEQKYAAAADLAAAAVRADPKVLYDWRDVGRMAGWAARAGLGRGADAAGLTAERRAAYRAQARAWLRESFDAIPPSARKPFADHVRESRELALLRDSKVLADLPDAERTAWRKLWDDFDRVRGDVFERPPEAPQELPTASRYPVAPPPREKK
ncbi:MAG TPA: hypothetical protein VM529_07210, partial [Gemmata sp.]|nr:hypothetical protein [Gemmata sp.]